MRTFHTARCTLEPQVEAHAAEMFVVLSDPAIYTCEGVPPPSVEKLASRFWRQGIGRSAVQGMLDELRATYGVHTFVAVLKTASFRSLGLLRQLGFEPGTPQDAALYEAEDDESTWVRPA